MVSVTVRRKIRVSDTGDVDITKEEVADSRRTSSGGPDKPTVTLYYFPDYTQTNPYQELLYSNLPANITATFGSIDDAARMSVDHNTAFHLHWPEPLFANCQSTDDFAFVSTVFFQKIDFLQRNGGQFIVTMHNALPHDERRREHWLRFNQELVRTADRIHIHSAAALSTLRRLYRLEEDKILIAAHGNYEGAYPADISRSHARTELGLPADGLIYGFVGQLRPYKGLGTLVDAFRAIRSSVADAHLLIAGKPVHPMVPGYWKRIGQVQANTSVFEGYIPDHELQTYFAASDVIVLPYTDILTSGSVMLAASFGKPMIFPDLETLAEEKQAGLGITYDNRDPDGLTKALLAFAETSGETRLAISESARRFSQSRSWPAISNAFGSAVDLLWTGNRESRRTVAGHDVVVTTTGDLDARGTIGIAIVSYHSVDDIAGLLESLTEAATGKRITLFILDNTGDGSDMHALRRLSKEAVLIRAGENTGYAGGNNIILELMSEFGCAYGAILNPDIRVERGCFDILLEATERHPNAVLSPLVCKDNGRISFAGGYRQHGADISIKHFLDGRSVAEAPQAPYSVDVLNGCAVFAPVDVLRKMGPIPEIYFLYYEETDWFLKASELGIDRIIVPAARVNHDKRSHGKLVPSLYYLYYLTRSTFLINARFGGSLEAARRRMTSAFIKPWRDKLARSHPGFLAIFDRVISVAMEDGSNLWEGPVDIGERMDSGLEAPEDIGMVEYIDDDTIGGWVITSDLPGQSPDRPASVWLIVDDIPLEEQPANIRPGSDTPAATAAAASGKNGFCFQIPAALLDGGRHRIEVRLGANGMRLQFRDGGKTQLFRRTRIDEHRVGTSEIEARIDGIRNGKLIGWVRDKTLEYRTVYVDIEVDGRLIENLAADVVRPDLVRPGFGDGRHGFSIALPNDILAKEDVTAAIFKNNTRTKIREGSWKPVKDAAGFRTSYDGADFLHWAYTAYEIPEGAYQQSPSLQEFFAGNRRYYGAGGLGRHDQLVSVIMPAFNRAGIIEDSIRSVLGQTYRHWELLIVDDGSSDGTADFVELLIGKIGDDRLKLIRLDTNVGVSRARNAGLERARGEFICYLDSDNQWYEDCLSVLLTALEDNPDYECAYAGQEIWEVLQHFGTTEMRTVRASPFNRSKLEFRNFIDLNVFAHRRSAYERLGGFKTDMKRLVDWELILRYTKEKPAFFVPVLVNKYFVARAENQITATENYEENLDKLRSLYTLRIEDFYK